MAQDCAKRNATVIMACRNRKKTERIIQEIKQTIENANIQFVELDLQSLDSVRACAIEIVTSFSKVDVLVNNAG